MRAIQVFWLLMVLPNLVLSQTKRKDSIVDKPTRAAFESSFIIENPTNIVFPKGSMEMQIKHRFGLINGADDDLAGLWAPSNIRLGISFAVHDNWTIGIGTTKFDRIHDLNLKAALLRQTRSGKKPVSITYFGNFAIDSRNQSGFKFEQDRFSFFHQLIIARRFGPNFSLQIAPSVSHYNLVEPRMRNDKVAVAIGGRYKISPQTAILFDYSHPFTHHLGGETLEGDPEPGLALGMEFSTLGHAFQLFVSNYNGIVPQKNYMYNPNDFFSGEYMIGFNITRVFSF